MCISKLKYLLSLLLFASGFVSCSTQKNTKVSRSYHEMKTYHNIYYNGMISFLEGQDQIKQSNEDDYSQVLSLYPVSNHNAAQAASSQMDLAIEKCRKCIKLHSIHAKPKPDPKRSKDPEYKLWLQSKEFNAQMYRAWLLLGQAEFHKGDFLGSIGTFSYVSRLYENDNDIKAQCQLWIARAYAELGWQYEAEDMLQKVNIDHLKRKNHPLYSAVSADIMLKGGKIKEVIPFVKVAKNAEKRKQFKPRFEYVLGQLYQLDGQRNAALAAFQRVIKMHPEAAMDFHARLHCAQLQSDTTKSLKQLRKMTRLSKYDELLDELYGAIGNIYLHHHDTISALAAYEKGIEASTQKGLAMAALLIQAGDLYHETQDYPSAGRCYSEATKIITTDHNDYERVKKRSEILDELVVELNTITLQDSLQHLSTLSQEEQEAIVNQIIEDLIAKEKADSAKLAQQAREAELDEGIRSVNTQGLLGGSGDNSWYFYNAQLLRSGKQEFVRKWGNRPLEDNWRRLSKASVMQPIDEMSMGNEDDTLPSDSTDNTTNTAQVPTPMVTDVHQPQYYLQQIPKSEQDIKASNDLIAKAIKKLMNIYLDKMNDWDRSESAFEDYCRRFPNDSVLPDLYYVQYINALRLNRENDATYYAQQILERFPNTPQAKIVSDPTYFERLKRTLQEQDSLYELTYNAYTKGDFQIVKQNKDYAELNYPEAVLMPRFLFLNAIAVARTDGQEPFITCLKDMVMRYPNSDLGAIAKDMLAMMGQGMESQQGGTVSDLTQKRENVVQEDSALLAQSTLDENIEPHVLIEIAADEKQLNDLLYQVALFNFAQFMIKDFDLQTFHNYTATTSALRISGLESKEECEWYIGLMQKDATLSQYFIEIKAQIKVIH
ncbi:MAG: hypothetical protein J6J29_00955 [Paludibacteraceae bacterium]|nr:hypothetical protein [Paludibacteraceae bacterium]